jgi:hypothetical protein
MKKARTALLQRGTRTPSLLQTSSLKNGRQDFAVDSY